MERLLVEIGKREVSERTSFAQVKSAMESVKEYKIEKEGSFAKTLRDLEEKHRLDLLEHEQQMDLVKREKTLLEERIRKLKTKQDAETLHLRRKIEALEAEKIERWRRLPKPLPRTKAYSDRRRGENWEPARNLRLGQLSRRRNNLIERLHERSTWDSTEEYNSEVASHCTIQ